MIQHPTEAGKITQGGGEAAGTDILAEARAALTDTKCTDQMQDFFRVGLVRELRGLVEQLRSDYAQAVEDWGDNEASVLAENARLAYEVERLRGALDRVEALSNRLRADSESELITSKAVFRAFADEIDSALRGAQ